MKTSKCAPFNFDEIRVAAPCNADWDAMKGDDRVRFCGMCKKNVYNFSEMSRTEAEALIHEKDGRICAQFYRRPDGTILTDNCPVGLRAIRNRMRWGVVAATAAFVAVGAFVGMRSAKAAGVSIREVQPFKALQTAQPVKAFVDWIDPVLAKPTPVTSMMKGEVAYRPLPGLAPLPAPATQTNPPAKYY